MSIKYAITAVIFCFFALETFSSTPSIKNSGLEYISPLPGSELVNENTNIIIRGSSPIQNISAVRNIFDVRGSISGYHRGKIINSGNYIVLFQPDEPFQLGENVIVYIDKADNTNLLKPYTFSFTIRTNKIEAYGPPRISEEFPLFKGNNIYQNHFYPVIRGNMGDSLPSDFPRMTITQHGQTAPGYIFISNLFFGNIPTTPPYLMILDNSGAPVFYRKTPGDCFDFKLQNNLITYYDGASLQYYAMDSVYHVVDSFKCGNGYITDLHELRLLPNRHAFLMSYDTESVDMSRIVQDGDHNARVSGLIIQELDENKNVIFQWRSWDHFQITDATHENMTAHSIDYVHGNALEFDNDGNIILSSRHMDEITKIDHQTGQILWRMGGKNNQFTFINDPIGYSHQHAIRILDNGHFTMFDNGNYHNPPFSRALEYVVDEHTKTVSLVWQFRHNPDIYGGAMGYVQRFSNGNTLIGWGYADPSVTEVRPDGSVVYELSLALSTFSYRAFRYELNFHNNNQNSTTYSFHLAQNYPNPFNPGTTILYTLGANSNIKLTVYDMLGRKIRTLADEYQQSGNHLYQFDGSNLSSGIYFYVLKTNTFTDVKKMVLIK
ncbi:MAG: aryl-sulfate sulfotransferase [Ignavibacteria bacterium]|jgi:hypothetical protein